MENREWWEVSNLKKDEEKSSKLDDSDLNLKTDFGSYRKLLKSYDIEASMLSSHNDLNPLKKIDFIHKWTSFDKDSVLNVLDVGCGVGFTTHELGNYYSNSLVVGVDISSDGISYAKENFKKEKFICQGIDPKDPPLGEYDLIFCFEFYPFTRTNSLQTHKDYLSYFLSQLKQDGKLILFQKWENNDSISKNIDQIKIDLSMYKFNINRVPNAKIYSLIRFRYLSVIVDKFVRLILRKDHNKAIIVSKK